MSKLCHLVRRFPRPPLHDPGLAAAPFEQGVILTAKVASFVNRYASAILHELAERLIFGRYWPGLGFFNNDHSLAAFNLGPWLQIADKLPDVDGPARLPVSHSFGRGLEADR